ncbi:DUF808 domain-containing protein [Pseudomonas sp. SA3-5]|uniref:DUF808 domain-containing protein n=1 Tax=Pseudomonas aestuarii TaxID=3018340 RepID=A0ABT4XH06_9PSED|nr:DUF808 domain-containing protein [Pseudomonas aestuarii]MDA7087452.1 DUF808 domain-containing protein [Pseudomonas aestuarii]
MAGTSLFALLDDIASMLDDVALMTKVAAKKTAGMLGDDLALNAQQVSGVRAERELPVVWAVAKGSLLNKLILVPAALVISLLAPWVVTPLLMLGGAFLCYEGFETLAHKLRHGQDEEQQHKAKLTAALINPAVDLVAFERDKIKGAVRTDFILSAEIIVITLGTVTSEPLATQLAVLVGIALLMTVCVYGLVAGIVKLDDGGLYLSQRPGDGRVGRLLRSIGGGIISAAPYLMKGLAVVGTVAMFMVGGGILSHGIAGVHTLFEGFAHGLQTVPTLGGALAAITPTLLDMLLGVLAGALVLAGVTALGRLYRVFKPA